MGGKSSRDKGSRGERELVELCTSKGVPCQRVLGSGAWDGAKADVKFGVHLKEDGTMPDKDESQSIMRVEVKNRKDNPERFWQFLNQDKITKAVMMRRSRVPTGEMDDLNQVWGVFMGLDDYLELFKKAYPEFSDDETGKPE